MDNTTKPLPMEKFMPEVVLHESKQMYICMLKSNINLEAGTHCHDGYEFIVPFKDMPDIEIDGKVLFGSGNQIIPINPWQTHGAFQAMPEARFLDMLIDRVIIRDIVRNILGGGHLEFQNGLYRMSKGLQSMMSMFMEEASKDEIGRPAMLDSLSQSIAILLIREIPSNLQPLKKNSSEDYTFKIKTVIEYIHKNYRSECHLSELAVMAQMSSYHFIRVFKRCMGKTPHEYLTDIRLEQVKNLLGNKDLTIGDICCQCGFNNTSHFVRVFKKKTGITPSEYRMKIIR